MMLFARATQGIMTAATRVATIAFIRDQFSGREMARMISLVITVFMAAPVIAPGIGQFILSFGPWRWIFVALMLYGFFIGIWVLFRFRETLAKDKRLPLRPETIVHSYLTFCRNPVSVGYTLASACGFAGLFSYISAAEQIFIETFHIGDLFALAFAVVAIPLAIATVINSRLVERHGMRRIGHVAMCIYLGAGLLHMLAFLILDETVIIFLMFMATCLFALGLMGPNFTAIAMEPMGNLAGSASAMNGFLGTAIPAIFGGMIARAYDGTVGPIVIGIMLMGLFSTAIILFVEKGRIFEPLNRSHTDDPSEPHPSPMTREKPKS